MIVEEKILFYIVIPFISIFLLFFIAGFCLGIYYFYLFFRIKSKVKKVASNKKMSLRLFFPLSNVMNVEYIKKLKNPEIKKYLEKSQLIWRIYFKIFLILVISLILFMIILYILTHF